MTTNTNAAPDNCTILPDGSAFALASYPLPKDHWLYAPREYEPGAEEPKELPHPILTHAQSAEVVAAVRYAIRGATMCGKEEDFDPDALVQNAVYALCGPFKKTAFPAAAQPPAAPVAQGDARVQGLIAAADYIDGPASGYAAEHSYTEPSPMAKVAAALRQKAEQEDAAYQARRSDQGLMESEWGPMEDAPPHEDPPMHVAVVEGDDAVRTLQWNRDVAAFAYPVGTLLYAAHPAAPVAQGDALTPAARDVLAERQRQISTEGWTSEHDDKEHLPGELALAAASYICADEQDAPPAIWPWDWSWWKPRDRRRNLVKSGALILAEIDSIDRAQAKEGAKP